MDQNPQDFLQNLFKIAVKAAEPLSALSSFLPAKPRGKTIVIGAGKAAATMASSFEKLWEDAGNGSLSGVVVTPYGHGVACNSIEVLEASHPIPDENGLKAAQRLMQIVQGLNKEDLVVALISGGGSALLPAPLAGLTLSDEQVVNEILLKSGAPIDVMNAIRQHISAIKGGRLAYMAAPAKVVSLIISDVPGDKPSLVASGPTVPNNITRQDALRMLEQYKIILPDRVLQVLHSKEANSLSPDDKAFRDNEVHIIASNAHSLEMAAKAAKKYGIKAVILSDAIEGEAKDIGLMHGALTREIVLKNRPFKKPVLLLSGGETTVTIKDTITGEGGKGGRNSEFLLSFAIAIQGLQNIYALAADTDGIDGMGENAGAFADGDTITYMLEKGILARAALNNHDSWHAFNAVDELFSPGPTGTNVNDFRAILILDKKI